MQDIEKIIKLFEKAAISKMELEIDNIKIKLEKNENETKTVKQIPENIVHQSEQAENDTFVTSPVVGTFYLQKSPDSAPYVTVGKKVHKGDILCIVEAMKVMNEILADKDGEVTKIHVQNEDFVSFGNPLISIRSLS